MKQFDTTKVSKNNRKTLALKHLHLIFLIKMTWGAIKIIQGGVGRGLSGEVRGMGQKLRVSLFSNTPIKESYYFNEYVIYVIEI